MNKSSSAKKSSSTGASPTTNQADKAMHPIDIAVGKRIRVLRLRAGLTQQEMAKHLGVSFQQVQKYEVAGNRISMSRLWDMAQVMKVSMTDFFYDVNMTSEVAALSEEALRVAQDLDAIRSDELREKFTTLIRTCADTYRK